MLTIRLQRVGRKNDPSFRVILVEAKRAAKTGNYKEMLGSYDARTDRVDLRADRIKHWIAQGATVSDTVHNILVSQKVIEGKKINVLPRKSPPTKETVEHPSPDLSTEPSAQAAVPSEAGVEGDNPVAEEKQTA